MRSYRRIFVGATVATFVHGGALFSANFSSDPKLDVIIAPSALQVSLVKVKTSKPKSSPKKLVKKVPQKEVKKEAPVTNTKKGALAKVRPLNQHNMPPTYPDRARRLRWEGQVNLKILVNSKGFTEDIKLMKSSGYKILDQEAMRAIGKWRFEPARLLGKPIAKRIEIPVIFRLRN